MSEYKKILFRFYSSLLEEETVETMWASFFDEERGLFKIENIPFYVPSLASGDIVFAEFDEDEGQLTFREMVEYSGNSTIQVILFNQDDNINVIRTYFNELGCSSELFKGRYFVIDVPKNINYMIVKSKLRELQSQGILDYAESCLSDNHRVDS